MGIAVESPTCEQVFTSIKFSGSKGVSTDHTVSLVFCSHWLPGRLNIECLWLGGIARTYANSTFPFITEILEWIHLITLSWLLCFIAWCITLLEDGNCCQPLCALYTVDVGLTICVILSLPTVLVDSKLHVYFHYFSCTFFFFFFCYSNYLTQLFTTEYGPINEYSVSPYSEICFHTLKTNFLLWEFLFCGMYTWITSQGV